ncbi:hypothetical protein M8J76_009148 [Diaphorina citri]|nr:hypothetical protein M8J75_001987 [Diaphorina citri]KAI5723646.1 hypothetical protein M8J76_009148 [Diaphorina citri]
MFVPSLVVLLALGAQSAVIHLEEVPDLLGVHSTSVYRDEPPIDLTKSLIIPNLRIFSDITRIFYAPGSDEPVSLQYTCEIPGTDILTKGFGIIPCACHKEELYCACCVYVRLERINFERTACSNLTIHRNSLELDMTIDYSGYTLAKRTISCLNSNYDDPMIGI